MSILVREASWEQIRTMFTEEEKQSLREAKEGEVICPRGWVLNEDKLSEDLRFRIETALRNVTS